MYLFYIDGPIEEHLKLLREFDNLCDMKVYYNGKKILTKLKNCFHLEQEPEKWLCLDNIKSTHYIIKVKSKINMDLDDLIEKINSVKFAYEDESLLILKYWQSINE